MCNDYRLLIDIASIAEDFDDLKIKIKLPEGMPNVEARLDIKISDKAPIIRGIEGERYAGELMSRTWGWAGRNGKPVYNFISEGRQFPDRRCLILADGFYEFTPPENPRQKRKDKWLFTLRDHRFFCIAGIWRPQQVGREAFTMLTIDAGPDVKPYHDRQIVPLPRDRWADWLDTSITADKVLGALPKGSLTVERVFPPAGLESVLV